MTEQSNPLLEEVLDILEEKFHPIHIGWQVTDYDGNELCGWKKKAENGGLFTMYHNKDANTYMIKFAKNDFNMPRTIFEGKLKMHLGWSFIWEAIKDCGDKEDG